MTFWQKIKQAFRSFMFGRNGADHLSVALLWAGLILYLLGGIVGSIAVSVIFPILGILLNVTGFACYVLCIFRMFSRNVDKRRAENRRYVTMAEKKRTERRQAKVRFQNRKTYKYFKCPGCKAWLRLKRGSGVVTITCSRCHTSFTQKS
jgi:LSD1 subclass zinc finger protein